MTKLSLVLILVICFLQTGIGRKTSGSSSRGSVGGGGWSLGGSGGSSSSSSGSSNRGNIGGGGWNLGGSSSGGNKGSAGGSSSGNTGSVGAGGWNTGGSSSGNAGSAGAGGWNAGGSSSGKTGNVGAGGWNAGGSSSGNTGSAGAGGWNAGGSSSGKTGSAGAGGWNAGGSDSGSKTSSGKKGIFGGLFGKKKDKSSSGELGKKKGSKLKTLKKAAVIGAVAYGGYKIGQLTTRFSSMGHSNNMGYGFNDWNRWRQQDGFLCRNDRDCSWIDPSLECDDYEFDFSPSNMWFGGDVASIRGQCECKNSFIWNDDDLHCLKGRSNYRGGSSGGGGGGGGLGGLIISIIVILSMVCCCCCIGCVFIAKMFLAKASEGA